MALALFDRVQETTTTTGTGSVTLGGAVPGFQSFAVVGNGNTCYYTIVDGTAWEVGIGTYSTSGPTLARTTVLSNSSGTTSPITLAAGTKTIFLTYPAEKSVNLDASGNVSPLGTVSSGVWQGSTVGVAYGGTGVTASSGANSVMLRDANQNVSINRLNQSSTTITAAGTTTTLTAASTFSQILVGTGGQTFKLPDATTLTNTTTFEFNNNATGVLTITDNANATVGTITSGGAAAIALLSNGTVGGTWDVHAYIPENVTWGTNSLALSTTVITGGTWNGGTIATGYGGTGLTSYTSGGAVYANSSSTLTSGTLPLTAGGTAATTASGARTSLDVPSTTGSGASGTWGINITGSASGSAGSVANAATFNSSGSGDASGTTFNGSAARTISYNTIGAPSTTGTNASGTWGINVTGNAGTAGYIINTNIGRTGSNGFISTTSWGTAEWANQPVSGLGMTIANTPGAPNTNYGFFNKFGNRDAGGPGWGGMWMEYDGGSLWYGATVVSTSYAGWKKVLDTSNYNSYAPTLTGTGATGTWNINISGNAATATSSSGSSSVNTSSSTGIQSNYIAAINTATPGTGTYGVNFLGSSQTDYAQGITWTWSSAGTAQAGIYVQSSGGYGTKMYIATTDSFATGSKTSMSIDHVGTIQVPRSYLQSDYSLRAPIFYDSNNTGYYVDPASGSNLAGTITMNGGKLLVLSDSGGYGQVQINSSSTSTEATLLFGSGGSGQNSGGYTYAGVIGLGAYGLSKANLYFGAGYSAPSMFIPNSSPYVEALNSFRAPIFYDSNDTGYYVDPNNSSVFNTTYANEIRTQNVPNANAVLGSYSASWSGNPYPTLYGTSADRWVMHINPHIVYAQNGTGGYTGTTQGAMIRFSGTVTASVAWDAGCLASIGADTWGVYRNGSGYRFYSDSSANLYAAGSMRAPIFYDSNDTAYYVDPNSQTYIYYASVNVGNEAPNSGAANSSNQGLVMRGNYNSNSWAHKFHKYDNGSGVALYVSQTVGAGAWGALQGWGNGIGYTSVVYGTLSTTADYSPIYYDRDNTACYVDASNGTSANFYGSVNAQTYNYAGLLVNANGTSSSGAAFAIQQVTGEGWTGIFVDFEPYTGWGLYHDNPNNYFCVTAESAGGAIRSFTVPSRYSGNRTAYEKIRFDQGSGDIISGGISYAYGSMRSPIFYDYNNTGYYCDPASTSVLNAVNWYGLQNWAGDGTYAKGTPTYGFRFNNSADTINAFIINNSGDTTSYSSSRAPIFYDSDNTAYYCNPNSGSNFVSLTVANSIAGYVNGASFNNDSEDVSNIVNRVTTGFWQNSGATTATGWPVNSGSWQHLISCTHSNDNNYYALQLAATFFDQGLFYRSTNGNGSTGWSRLVMYGNNYGSSLYGTIFYDSDNTAYYVDPASGSRMNGINADSLYSYGNVTAYSDERLKTDWEVLPADFVEKLAKVKSGTYTRIDSGERQVGVGAQSLQVILKEAVSDSQEYLGVNYGNAALASAVELAKYVTALEQRIAQLEARL